MDYVFPPPFLEPPPPPPLPASAAGPAPSGPEGGSFLQSWPPDLLRRASSLPAPVPPCILMTSGSCCLCMGTLLHVFERHGRLHSLEIARPRPHPRATWSCRRRSGRPDTPTLSPSLFPCVILIPSPSVLLVRGVRSQRRILLSCPGLLG